MKNILKLASLLVLMGVMAFAQEAKVGKIKASTKFFNQIEKSSNGNKEKVDALKTTDRVKTTIWMHILYGEKEESAKLKKGLNSLLDKLRVEGLDDELKSWEYTRLQVKSLKFNKNTSKEDILKQYPIKYQR